MRPPGCERYGSCDAPSEDEVDADADDVAIVVAGRSRRGRHWWLSTAFWMAYWALRMNTPS